MLEGLLAGICLEDKIQVGKNENLEHLVALNPFIYSRKRAKINSGIDSFQRKNGAEKDRKNKARFANGNRRMVENWHHTPSREMRRAHKFQKTKTETQNQKDG